MKAIKITQKFILVTVLAATLLLPLSGQAALTRTDYVRSGYFDILDRFPTDAELQLRLRSFPGFTALKLILNKQLPERDNAIIAIYQAALKRNPMASELTALKGFVATTNAIREQLFTSLERKLALVDIYQKYICRAPRQDEQDFFIITRTPFDRIREWLNTHKERCFPAGKPVAKVAGPVSLGAETVEFVLDGSQSFDPEAQALSYQWSLVNSSVQGAFLRDASAAMAVLGLAKDPNFVDPYALPGEYLIQLVVSDGVNASEPAFIRVAVDFHTTFEKLMLVKVNALRASEGQGALPLQLNARLTASARKYSRYMRLNNWFAHNSMDGKNFGERITAEGYAWSTVGENIGVVKSDRNDLTINEQQVEFMFNGWRNSPSHYTNMISANFNEIGVGFTVGPVSDFEFPFQLYATQDFGIAR